MTLSMNMDMGEGTIFPRLMKYINIESYLHWITELVMTRQKA